MKTDNKEEGDKSGKEGKWRALSLKERILLILLGTLSFALYPGPTQLSLTGVVPSY